MGRLAARDRLQLDPLHRRELSALPRVLGAHRFLDRLHLRPQTAFAIVDRFARPLRGVERRFGLGHVPVGHPVIAPSRSSPRPWIEENF